MLNKQICDLVEKILDSDIERGAKTEIVKFMLLPRNTAVTPPIEQPEETEDLGSIKRPTIHDQERKRNPKMAAGEDAMKKTLKGRIDK